MKRLAFFVFIFFCTLNVLSQAPAESSVEVLRSSTGNRDLVLQILSSIPGADRELINGKEYYRYYTRAHNKPVLFQNEKYLKSISVNGRRYNEAPVFYDTFADRVIFTDTSRLINFNVVMIEMNRHIIDDFTYYRPGDTIRFRYMSKASDPEFNLPDGFYEIAYSGEFSFLIRHRSVIYEKNGIDEYYYKPVNYISTGRGYRKIVSEKQFLDLFSADNQSEIRKILNQENVRFRDADKVHIVGLLKKCELISAAG